MNFALKSEGALKSKYNVTFGQCLECAKEQRSMGWCETCESNAFKANFKNWSSGNLVIDDLIRHTQLNASGSVDYLEYIEFEKFDLVEYKNKSGAFSTIYSAIWLEGPRRIWDHHAGLWTRNGPIKVALKRLNNSQNISKEYLNQLYEYHHCLQIGSIVDYFGITKDPTSNYMFVMSYYENDLYSYLDEAQGTICWRDTVEMLWEISGGIEYIHENGLIHGNLHGGNLLVNDKQDSIDIHIDMGLYGPADKKESNDIYGVLPYVAPEILQGNPPTKELDIYSFGIIMWTLSAGIRPWCNRPHDLTLATEVCSGLRPEIIDGTPDAYIQLMKKCWHSDPLKRPTASQICELLESWITAICDEPDQSELSDQFDIAEEKKFSDLIKSKFRKQQIHPQAFYTSRRLYFLN